jgi:hypothetical protein
LWVEGFTAEGTEDTEKIGRREERRKLEARRQGKGRLNLASHTEIHSRVKPKSVSRLLFILCVLCALCGERLFLILAFLC